MGGELTGRRLDLNFMSDRAAARHVISANLPTVIVPIQSPVVDLMIWIFPYFYRKSTAKGNLLTGIFYILLL